MRVLTVSEFQDWHSNTQPKEYIFASANQPLSEYRNPRMSIRFAGVFVCPELCQICFTGNKRDSLFFDKVKEVHMLDDKRSIGNVFDILCGGTDEKIFRMIAD